MADRPVGRLDACRTLTPAAAGAQARACGRLGLLIALSAWLLPAHAGSLTVDVRTAQGAPVENSVVWLESSASPKPRLGSNAEIQQVKLEFVPFITVLPVGTRVDFPNRDKVKHHVYSFSPAKSFEIQLYSGSPAEPIVFDKPGVVVLGCNIHDWMEAYVVVVDSTWFAKADASGHVALDGLPPGHYTAHVWHPYLKSAASVQTLDVTPAHDPQRLQWTVELAVPMRKPRRPVDDHY